MSAPVAGLTAPQLIEAYSQMTNIRFRIFVPDVEAQAIRFLAAGYTLRDLELVILWIRRQVAAGKGGLSEASVQWHTLFGKRGAGDEFAAFQNRLGLAQEEIRRRKWRPPFRLSGGTGYPPVPAGDSPAGPGSKRTEDPAAWDRAAAAMRETKEKLARGER